MKESTLSVEEFKRLIPRVKCISLFHYNLLNSSKLKEICTTTRRKLESARELDSIKDVNLVWYVDGEGNRVMWDQPGSRNIILGALAADYITEPSQMDDKLRSTVDSLRGGLKNNIEIICVHDSTLDATVLVDGVYRAIALYYLYLAEPGLIDSMLNSSFSIETVTLSSPAGALLFPCDFVNICREIRNNTQASPRI